jgi:hypothetical protein
MVRIMTAMHFADRLGINVAGFGADENSVFEMSLENALQRQKKRRPIVAMKIGPAFGHDLGGIDLNLRLRVLRD